MRKKLTKSETNRLVTGTLGGIAEYFNIDPTIVRVLFVFIFFGSFGTLFFLYLVLALVIPSKTSTNGRGYGHNNPYYQNNQKRPEQKEERKEAEKVNEDDWSDF
jgi:phage shock protein PspC (stress-responsive transcriptional regulator)